MNVPDALPASEEFESETVRMIARCRRHQGPSVAPHEIPGSICREETPAGQRIERVEGEGVVEGYRPIEVETWPYAGDAT